LKVKGKKYDIKSDKYESARPGDSSQFQDAIECQENHQALVEKHQPIEILFDKGCCQYIYKEYKDQRPSILKKNPDSRIGK
jgi:hypothetical protein